MADKIAGRKAEAVTTQCTCGRPVIVGPIDEIGIRVVLDADGVDTLAERRAYARGELTYRIWSARITTRAWSQIRDTPPGTPDRLGRPMVVHLTHTCTATTRRTA
jgi:hypothetical protein